jgi:hypothetical protein
MSLIQPMRMESFVILNIVLTVFDKIVIILPKIINETKNEDI